MNRLPKGTKAQVMGTRLFQTMYTADQMRKAVADERELVLACERIRIQTRIDTLKTAIELLKAENAELKAMGTA